MPGSAPARPNDDRSDADTWPWRCLGCGATIYHDVECCRDCARGRRTGGNRPAAETPTGFLGWIADESLPGFSLKVTAISGVEVTLTAAWLRLLLRESAVLAHLASFAVV